MVSTTTQTLRSVLLIYIANEPLWDALRWQTLLPKVCTARPLFKCGNRSGGVHEINKLSASRRSTVRTGLHSDADGRVPDKTVPLQFTMAVSPLVVSADPHQFEALHNRSVSMLDWEHYGFQ